MTPGRLLKAVNEYEKYIFKVELADGYLQEQI